MKLYHWKSQGADLFIMSISEEAARATIMTNIRQWAWQDNPKFANMLKDMELPPYYVADHGHVIAINYDTV